MSFEEPEETCRISLKLDTILIGLGIIGILFLLLKKDKPVESRVVHVYEGRAHVVQDAQRIDDLV